MTWGEFKERLERNGIEDTDEIGYIDMQGDEGVLRISRYPGRNKGAIGGYRFSVE